MTHLKYLLLTKYIILIRRDECRIELDEILNLYCGSHGARIYMIQRGVPIFAYNNYEKGIISSELERRLGRVC